MSRKEYIRKLDNLNKLSNGVYFTLCTSGIDIEDDMISLHKDQLKNLYDILECMKFEHSLKFKLYSVYYKIKDFILFKNYRDKRKKDLRSRQIAKELEAFDEITHMLRNESI
jgi:hypothetical protein